MLLNQIVCRLEATAGTPGLQNHMVSPRSNSADYQQIKFPGIQSMEISRANLGIALWNFRCCNIKAKIKKVSFRRKNLDLFS